MGQRLRRPPHGTFDTLTRKENRVNTFLQRQVPLARLGQLYTASRGHRAVLGFALLLSLAAALLTVLQPRVLQDLVNELVSGRSVAGRLMGLAELALGTALVQGLQGYLVQRGAESVALSLRARLVDRYLTRTVAAHDRANTADLLSRATLDVNVVKTMIAAGAVPIVGSVVMLVGVASFMIAIDVVLFIATAAVVLLGFSAVLVVGRTVRGTSLSLQTSIGDFGASIERMLASIRTVKAARAEASEASAIDARSRSVWAHGLRLARLVAIVQPIVNLCVQGALLLVVVLGTLRLVSGALDVGELLAFLVYLFMLVVPLAGIGQAYTQLQVGFGALARLEAVDDLECEDEFIVREQSACADIAVAFDTVDFAYEEGLPVLSACSFEIQSGETVALVGRSGSGKSTVVELLERFYEPDSGVVSVGGTNAWSMSAAEHRSRLALIAQESDALTGTVRDNLSLARDGVRDDEMQLALERVGLTGPDGRTDLTLDTDVGQGGVALSGGQRQRLAWARLLLTDAEVLLLDEPTSHLDSATEAAMYLLLDELSEGRTVLMATHRTSGVERADRVLVLEGGRVTAAGRHADLFCESEPYRRLQSESNSVSTGEDLS